MNSVDLTPFYRSTIGFDRMVSLIDNVMKSEASVAQYPQYDIEVIEDNHYKITLAVAGFSKDEIDINVDQGVLTISGNKAANDNAKYLHNSIVCKSFKRRFTLAEYVDVTNADLCDGILTISLVREIPEAMKPRSVLINQTSKRLSHDKGSKAKPKPSGSKAA